MDYSIVYPCTVSAVEMQVSCDNPSSVLCCLAVQLQMLAIGVTTNSPDIGPLPQRWGDIHSSDQYWYVVIWSGGCEALHNEQKRVLQWSLDCSAGNTFGCRVLETGELHLYHNGRDVGVVWEGLPTDQPLLGFVTLCGWKVEANYVIAKGEAAWCDILCKSAPCLNLHVNCECV